MAILLIHQSCILLDNSRWYCCEDKVGYWLKLPDKFHLVDVSGLAENKTSILKISDNH